LDNNSIKKELPLLGLKSIALGMVDDQPIALKLEFHVRCPCSSSIPIFT